VQEVQRAAGSQELVAPGDRARLGAEAIDGKAFLAEFRRGVRHPVKIPAIQPAVDLCELVVDVVDPEIAPQAVIVVALRFHIELPERRRELLRGAVVAVGRVVIRGIDAPEQRVGRLVEEVAEQVFDRRLAGIGARRHPPIVGEFLRREERQAPVNARIVVERRVRALHLLLCAGRVVLGDREVRHAEVEAIARLELQVAKVKCAVAFLIEHRDLDRVCARRQHFLGDEVALGVDRHLVTRHPHRVFGRNAAATHRNRAATHPDVLVRERAFAVGREQVGFLQRHVLDSRALRRRVLGRRRRTRTARGIGTRA